MAQSQRLWVGQRAGAEAEACLWCKQEGLPLTSPFKIDSICIKPLLCNLGLFSISVLPVHEWVYNIFTDADHGEQCSVKTSQVSSVYRQSCTKTAGQNDLSPISLISHAALNKHSQDPV